MSPKALARPVLAAGLAFGILSACVESPTRAPDLPEVRAGKGGGGKGGGGGGADPTVDDVDPSSAPQDVTLDVQVFGANYDDGSVVDMLLNGKTTQKVKTNSTTFVNDTALIANITIAPDAEVDLYDVQVTTSRGKKGVGIELFAVTGPQTDLGDRPPEPAPAGLYEDGLGLYPGKFVNTKGKGQTSNANYNTRPQCDEGRSADMELPKDGGGNPVWVLSGPASDCSGAGPAEGHTQFHIPGLLIADCPHGQVCPIGVSGGTMSERLNYFFLVDSNGDGKFAANKDDGYNVVWTDGLFSVLARGSGDVPCQWHVTAGTADLYLWGDLQQPTGQPVSLDAIVFRNDGPCSP